MPSDEDIDYIVAQGVVSHIVGHGFFEVKVGEKTLLATMCGRMRQHRISILPDDAVTVHISMYDLDKCVIRFRHLNKSGYKS
jgi:translation initiation factor IF-1